jgi:hypothetical protein
MLTPTHPLAQLVSEIKKQGLTPGNAERMGRELAANFGVQEDEVGILRVEGSALVFCYPERLQGVGRIPLNSSASVAARTAHNRRGEIINNFSQVKHASFFEAVDLNPVSEDAVERPDTSSRVIQKLMSVPLLAGTKTLGVLQVSRKGSNAVASRDFTPDDLRNLTTAADLLAKCFE